MKQCQDEAEKLIPNAIFIAADSLEILVLESGILGSSIPLPLGLSLRCRGKHFASRQGVPPLCFHDFQN